MRTMKKIVALMTALSLCAAFAACGKKSEDNNSTPDIPVAEDNSSLSAEVEEDTTAEETEGEGETEEYVDPINPYNPYTPEQMEMLGLSYDEEGNVIDAGGMIRVPINGDSDGNGDDEEDGGITYLYSPSTEIQNASFGDGLIQIGEDVFPQGGYITINEFIEQYGDKYSTPDIQPDKEIDREGWHFEYPAYLESGMKINLFCTEPASDSNLIGDAVIISFEPGNDGLPDGERTDDNTWLPHGIRYRNNPEAPTEKEDIVSCCEDEGFVLADSILTPPVAEDFSIGDMVGKYTYADEGNDVILAQRLSKPNLYGYTPIVSYNYIDKSHYFENWYIEYNDGKGQAIGSEYFGLKTKVN